MKDSILGPTGGQMTETGRDTNGSMAWMHTNVRVGGELVATYDPNGLHFYLNDWLGSRRVQTDYQGIVEQTCTNLPYGDGETCGPDPSESVFAGLDRDSDAGVKGGAKAGQCGGVKVGQWNVVGVWKSQRVQVGRRYPMEDGHVEVDSVEPIGFPDITPELARASGFAGLIDLLKVAKHGSGDKIFLIHFHYIPPKSKQIPQKH